MEQNITRAKVQGNDDGDGRWKGPKDIALLESSDTGKPPLQHCYQGGIDISGSSTVIEYKEYRLCVPAQCVVFGDSSVAESVLCKSVRFVAFLLQTRQALRLMLC
jgi:hypothetical protein